MYSWSSLLKTPVKRKIVRVIEQYYFDSTPDPFNGQTANFIVKPPRVIESRSYVKKANLEGYWNNTVDIYSWSSLVLGRRGFVFLIFINLSYAQLIKWGYSTNCVPHNIEIWDLFCLGMYPQGSKSVWLCG